MKRFLFKNCDYKLLLKEIKDSGIKIDAVITDPPYGVSRKNQLGFSNMGRSGMNYGEWDYNFDQKEWIRLCAPLIKPGGSIIVFNDWKNFSYIVEELDDQGFSMKDVIRWVKPNPMPRNTARRYVGDFELAIWAVKDGGKWTFNKTEGSSYLRPIYKCPSVSSAKRLHPTQKPLKLIEDILKVHTNENDVVLDLFTGSGTTAEACLKNNRIFIGSELDKDYYEKAMERLKCYIPQ
mgnify:FL=1